MTDSDKEFAREHYKSAIALIHLASTTITKPESLVLWIMQDAHTKLRFLTLLIESEAMREKAEWKLKHKLVRMRGADFCLGCNHYEDEGLDSIHSWTDLDWIAAVRKEIEG